jgi:hypothetical protein
MNRTLFLRSFAVFILPALWTASAFSQTVITFDDISTPSIFASIPNGYQGLNWSTNFSTLNAFSFTGGSALNGYYYGMVSSSNVAYNGSASPAEIDAQGTNFDFLSAYLTGAWNSNLNIEVEGFRSGGLLYDTTVVVGATSPTLFTLDYLNIDRLTFNSFGGQSAGFSSHGGANFVMDNFTFDFVPEPSPLLLATAGALLLCPLLKRKRA